MSSFKRLRFLLSNWRQILGFDTSVRDQTAAIQHELQRLREHRRVIEAAREKEALEDLRRLVGKMKDLEKDLDAAEMAAVQLVDSLGEQAKQQLTADLSAEAETLIEAALRTSRTIVPEPQVDSSPSASSDVAEQPQIPEASGVKS